MSIAIHKRSVMALYSSYTDPYSHRVRIALAEKGVTADILDVNSSLKLQEELREINPYNTIPTLVDRELVLFRSEIILEYLDERFPHPPLMPIYPIAKGRTRLMIYRINYDWYRHLDVMMSPNATEEAKVDAKIQLVDSITSVTQVFAETPYFLNEDFSLIDCCIAPLLWLLPKFGIDLTTKPGPICDYAERLFAREAFKASITVHETLVRI